MYLRMLGRVKNKDGSVSYIVIRGDEQSDLYR